MTDAIGVNRCLACGRLLGQGLPDVIPEVGNRVQCGCGSELELVRIVDAGTYLWAVIEWAKIERAPKPGTGPGQ